MRNYFPKSQLDGGSFTDFESFCFFILGKKYYDYDSMYFKGTPDIYQKIMSFLHSMEADGCFTIKKHAIEQFTAYFLLDNIDKNSLVNHFLKKNFFEQQNLGLKSENLTLDEAKFILKGRMGKVKLVPDTDEYYLCKVMLSYKVDKPEDWSVIFEKVKGSLSNNLAESEKEFNKKIMYKNKKSLSDTASRLNRKIRIAFQTDENFLSFTGKSIKRNY